MDYEQAYNRLREKIALRFGSNVADEVFFEFGESEDERIREEIHIYLDWLDGRKDYAPKGVYSIKDMIAWLEKQGEQKSILDFKASNWYVSKVDGKIHDLTYNPTDKVKPKFKVGDWIVYNDNLYHIGNIALQRYYECLRVDGTVHTFGLDIDSKSHLWAIQDAKDGDVLYHSNTASNGIFIFKELLKYEFGEKVICYCDYDSEDGFCLGESHTCCWADAKILHPATKEQHDLLFQKMKEAGWEFDFENKELKKINSYCQENCKGYQETGKCFADGGCDSKRKAEQKSISWSEEDEEELGIAIKYLQQAGQWDSATWVESLKTRLRGQRT